MYAVIETTVSESKWLKEPVISIIKTIPVIGALTIAVKYPAIARIIKLLKRLSSKIPFPIITCPKILPIVAPKISKGKNIPPGAPDAKLNIEKINLTIKIKTRKLIPFLRFRYSILLWPPPVASGKTKPRNPARIKGIIIFVLILRKVNFL